MELRGLGGSNFRRSCGRGLAALHLAACAFTGACSSVDVIEGPRGDGGSAPEAVAVTATAGTGGAGGEIGAGGAGGALPCPPLGPEPEVFFSKDYSVVDMFTRFVIGEDTIYLADGATGIVRSLPKYCNALPVVLAEEEPALADLAMNATWVSWATASWAEDDDEAIRILPVAGGQVGTFLVLPTGQEPQHLTLDDTHAYWLANAAGGGALRRADLATGTVETLASLSDSPALGGLALDDTNVYFTDGVEVYELPKVGGSPTLIGVSDDFWISALSIDQEFVYWPGNDVVWRAPKGGAGPRTVVGKGLNGPQEVLLDGDYVYFSALLSGEIGRFPKEGGSEPEILAQATQSAPKQIAIDGDAFYWLDPGQGAIFRMMKPR